MKSASLNIEIDGRIAIVAVDRPAKRNALDDATMNGLGRFFAAPPEGVAAAVLRGEGKHFSAGLDLSEIKERDAAEGVDHSRMWHEALGHVQFGKVPVVAVLHGAVVGGGLELAAAAHIRVAEPSAYFALPEGRHGIFVGGGGSVRISRLIGVARMADMMLTGRVLSAEEGERVGLVHYMAPEGQGLSLGMEIARKIAENPPLTNFAVLQALPRIAESGRDEGLFAESLIAAIAQSAPEAKARIRKFLDKRGDKVKQP